MFKKKFFIYPLLIFAVTISYPILFQSKAYASGTDDLLLKVQTDSNNQFHVPIDTSYTYNYNIDCDNDGSFEATGVNTDYTCSYSSNETYTIRIEDNTGTDDGFPHIYFYNANQTDRDNLLEIQQWGNMKWQTMNNAFYYCSNISITATDTPDLSNVTDMAHMFDHATNFNSNISSWDVSNVTDFHHMFYGDTLFNQPLNSWNMSNAVDISNMFVYNSHFNQPLNNWDTSSVTNMMGVFSYTDIFNQPLDNWDTSKVTNMYGMFSYAYKFNQDISSWDVSKVQNMYGMFAYAYDFNQALNSWNVGNVTNMEGMFALATSFNQPLNSWDVSKVTDMITMFYGASTFNQDLSAWNISNVTDMSNMFTGSALTRTNYDKILNGWDSLPTLQNNVILGASGINYCNSESARNDLISTYNWTINDAGKDCSIITRSANLLVITDPDTVDTQTTMTLKYTLPMDLEANANISITYDSDFSGGDSLTNNDISITSTNNNIGTCTASNFSNGYFDITCTGTATESELLTIVIGGTNKLTTPSNPGNYNVAIVIDNKNLTYMNVASLSYVGDDNDVNITAYVPAVLDLDIYEAGTNVETSSCDLGVLSVNKVNSCSYDISAGTNNPTGLTIMMHGVLTSDWSTGSNTLTHSDGSHTINAVSDGSVTAGYSEYGFQITDKGNDSFTANNSYDTQHSAVPSSESAVATTSTTLDGANDITKRLEITHYASMSNDTVSGNYSQGVVWTAFTN